MNYLRIDGVSKAYGERTLFQHIDLSIDQGDKIALVANNGAGKTSLLRIIAGTESPDTGTAVLQKNIRFDYLDQEPSFAPGLNVYEAIFDGDNPLMKAVARYEKALLAAETNSENEHFQRELSESMHEMDVHDAWNIETKVHTILHKLKLHKHLNADIASLSGGQQKRLAIARILIHNPDFVILDEPTNHLDIEMIEWLEAYLTEQDTTLLMVSHDRYFIDRVCNRIIELNLQKIHTYKGNYTYFLENKALREELEEKEFEAKKKLLGKELEWLRRQPKARTTKSKSRIQSAEQLMEDTSNRVRKTQMEFITETNRLGSKILELQQVQKQFGSHQISNGFTYIFRPGERIGIIGNNGTGKTSFLEMILGNSLPDSGKIIHGDTVQFGYFSQKGLQLNPEKKVIDIITDIAEYIDLGKGQKLTATALLKRFLFDYKKQQSPVSVLSGGEKRRLYLLTVLIKKPNFLILDEPTNDMDIETLNVLEDFLIQYPGNLLLVTHDRYFMDNMVDSLFVFEGEGKIRSFNGNYQDYLNEKEAERIRIKSEQDADKKKSKVESSSQPNAASKKKKSFKEQREFELLTSEIPDLEKQKSEILEKLNSSQADFEQMNQWSQEITRIELAISEKELRWLELSELE